MNRIVIIGGGLGGLTAGALLAQRGYRVVLLEQHRVVGGAATTFQRGAFTVEAGLHEMNDPLTNPGMREIFEQLGVYEHVDFIEPGEFFRVTSSRFDFTMPNRREEAVAALTARYPSEASGIIRYFELIDALAADLARIQGAAWWELALLPLLFPRVFRYRRRAVREVLDRLLGNEELKLILNANVGYYHTSPDSLSMLYHAAAQSSYFRGGGWYLRGGSQKLSDYLAAVISANGGEVLTGTEAIALETERGTARSVACRTATGAVTYEADAVISNLAPAQTYELARIPYAEKKDIACSIVSVYLGFRNNLKRVYGKQAYSRFFLRDMATIDDYNAALRLDVTERGFVFVDYSQIDSGLCPPEKSVGSIAAIDFFSVYERMAEAEYVRKKALIIDAYLGVLEEHYPGIRDLVEYAEVGTPRTMRRYLRTPGGTAYGFAPTAAQFFRQPQVRSNKLKNLYFVGAWVIGGGFTPAIYSGALCCRQMAKG